MDRQRQRKLDARIRRQQSLANSSGSAVEVPSQALPDNKFISSIPVFVDEVTQEEDDAFPSKEEFSFNKKAPVRETKKNIVGPSIHKEKKGTNKRNSP